MPIFFLDLDGTLLCDDKSISPGNSAAIQFALRSGSQAVITSGRPLASALAKAHQLGLDGKGCFVIAYNGGVIYDCELQKERFRETLSLDALAALFAEADRRGLHIQTYDDTSVLVQPRCDDPALQHYCGFTGLPYRVIPSLQGVQPPVKALCIDEDNWQNLEDFRLWANQTLGSQVYCMYSSRSYLEVVPPGTSKGGAVRALCASLGTPLQDAVAVGDEVNDISMIQAAGTGVAMANAIPEVKAAAAYVTQADNNHDGIAEVIYKFLS